MRVLGPLLSVIIGLALLAGLLAVSFWLFSYAVGVFGTLEPQLATLTAIASIISILCASIIAGGLKSGFTQGASSGMGIDKAALYKQLLSHMIERLKVDAGAVENETIDLEHRLALCGSPKVISAYMEFHRYLDAKKEQQGADVDALLTKLVKEMRADLNRPSLIFYENDLLGLLQRRN